MARTYHVGLLKRGEVLVVQVRRDLDTLSPELWRYCGERETSKRGLRQRLAAEFGAILDGINAEERTTFRAIRVDDREQGR